MRRVFLNLLPWAHSYVGTTLCRFQLSSPSPGSPTGVEGRLWSGARTQSAHNTWLTLKVQPYAAVMDLWRRRALIQNSSSCCSAFEEHFNHFHKDLFLYPSHHMISSIPHTWQPWNLKNCLISFRSDLHSGVFTPLSPSLSFSFLFLLAHIQHIATTALHCVYAKDKAGALQLGR